jgi:MYXO-CTERM domain-containing protein
VTDVLKRLGFALGVVCACAPSDESSLGTRVGVSHAAIMLSPNPVNNTDAKPGSHYGHAIAVGDFNHDGKNDVAVGAPGAFDGGGAVYVYYSVSSSGALSQSQTVTAPYPLGAVGAALAAADFDNDLTEDLAVGAPAAQGKGAAVIFQGVAGMGLGPSYSSVDTTQGSGMGTALLAVPQSNRADLWAGAPNDALGGHFDIFLGKPMTDGGVVTAPAAGGHFATSFARSNLSHISNTVFVGTPTLPGGGQVYTFDETGKASSTEPTKFAGPHAAYGASMAAVGQYPYLAIGAPGEGAIPGYVFVHSYVGGSPVETVIPGTAQTEFGFAVTGWDRDGTGNELVVVGVPGADIVQLYMTDGTFAGTVAPMTVPPVNARFGCAVEGHYDVTGDGIHDLIIGGEQDMSQGGVWIVPGTANTMGTDAGTGTGGGGGGASGTSGGGGGGGGGGASGTGGGGGGSSGGGGASGTGGGGGGNVGATDAGHTAAGGGGGGGGTAYPDAGMSGGGAGGGSGMGGGMASGGGSAMGGGMASGGGMGGGSEAGGGIGGGGEAMGGGEEVDAGSTGGGGNQGTGGGLNTQDPNFSTCGCTTGDGSALALLGGLLLRRRRR